VQHFSSATRRTFQPPFTTWENNYGDLEKFGQLIEAHHGD
jgi:hypothetical protein